MTVWFTSDTHYGHRNVIEYSNRPYSSVEEMDEAMVANWNSIVRPGDSVYHLGDFAFHRPARAAEIAKSLNGQKFLIWGNHDKALRRHPEFCSQWIWCRDLDSISVGDQKVILCHYAMLTWKESHRGSWQLHGHSHGTLPEDPHSLRIDVGVDPRGYFPISFEDVREIMSKKDYRPVDRHGKEGDER